MACRLRGDHSAQKTQASSALMQEALRVARRIASGVGKFAQQPTAEGELVESGGTGAAPLLDD